MAHFLQHFLGCVPYFLHVPEGVTEYLLRERTTPLKMKDFAVIFTLTACLDLQQHPTLRASSTSLNSNR